MEILSYLILPSQKVILSITQYNFTILQHPNFYFPILLIKIIFLHNKIIYPTITIIYNTTHYLLSLSLSFCSRTTITTTTAVHTLDTTTTPPYNLPSTPKKKKKNHSNPRSNPRCCIYCPSRCTTRPTLLHPLTTPLPTKVTPIEINPPPPTNPKPTPTQITTHLTHSTHATQH